LIQASPRDPDNFPFVVLGNKVDLENRAVSEMINLFCLFIFVNYGHVCVKTGFYETSSAVVPQQK